MKFATMSKKGKMIEEEEVQIHYVGSGKNRVIFSFILNDGNESVKWMQRVKGTGKVLGIGSLQLHSTRNNYSNCMLLKMKARNIHCIARECATSDVSVGLMGDAEKLEEGVR
jgi:hypothetical protein